MLSWFVASNSFAHFVRKLFSQKKLLSGKFWVFAPLPLAPSTKKTVRRKTGRAQSHQFPLSPSPLLGLCWGPLVLPQSWHRPDNRSAPRPVPTSERTLPPEMLSPPTAHEKLGARRTNVLSAGWTGCAVPLCYRDLREWSLGAADGSHPPTQATASARATKNPTGHGRLGLSRGEET